MARKAKDTRPPRRKRGTGTIRYKAGREKPWEAEFPIDKRECRYDYFLTRAEASAHLDQLVAERDDPKAPRNIAGGSQRVDAFLVDFLNRKAPHVKKKTLADYTYQCGLAGEYLGSLRIDEIKRPHADAMLLYYHRRGYHNGAQLRMVCAQAFEYAVEEHYISDNPFRKAAVAPVERREGVALTTYQRDALLLAAMDTWLAPLWHLYCRLALREGEGLGLRWGDLDRANGTITIVQQYTAVKGKVYKETPKTPKSRRTVPVPADILALLDTHRAAQRAHAAKTPEWREHGLMFPSSVGTPIPPRNLMRRYKALLKDAGLPSTLTIHDLRHTALYHLEQAGVAESTRMALAGHTQPSMAKHYTNHATIEEMRRAIG